MPSSTYQNRQICLMFPSPDDRDRWRELASKSRMGLSHWIFGTVEAYLAAESEDAQASDAQRASLQTENRQLRHELKKSEARLHDLETENYKLRNKMVIQANSGGLGNFQDVINIFQQGGTWSNTAILSELGVDSRDVDAIEIVTKQLHWLQDFGHVKESPRGWRWI